MAFTKLGTLTAGDVVTASAMNLGLVAGTGYSPSYTNITLGNATVISKYNMVGRLYVVRVQFTLGTTSAIGTSPIVSVPVNIADAGVQNLGTCDLVDVSAGTHYVGTVLYASASTVAIDAVNASATYLTAAACTATVPFTWATGDWFSFQIVYEGVS